ncbi:hypothetical protein GWI33_013977 [Rhynchophorus ferrugineus]|uniref:non-specific serine/threonine protein kinase n=1 Tax=Rhynchophorus ferrugineus TaxID=354439 RepID=A0A834M645_RHYFE|nr:hypothetical protein GWI33_013977 [Rhynchophorus ferrugineus]
MSEKPQMYIYHLPYEERRKLSLLLDQEGKWIELGLKHMQFDEYTIEGLKREVMKGNSPSCELLTLWGQQNHTVLELFILLNRMGLYQGMSIIKNFIDEKYHVLLKEDNLNKAVRKLRIADSKLPSENFDNGIKILTKDVKLPEYTGDSHDTTNINQKVDREVFAPIKNVKSPQVQLKIDSNKVLTACVVESAGATPQIPYEELQMATDKWSKTRILGQGGFGTVFRGTWKCTQVAIKRLETKDNSKKDLTEQIRQSITELHCLNAYRHDNILPLYGYSIGGPYPCLVYQYMSGGSLDSRIRTKDQRRLLNWPKRLTVGIGTARGLQFLHTTLHNNKPLIHGDIKSANILLDPMDQPRIGDFGLAREGPERHYTHIKVSRIQGTLPYLPDEFLRSKEFSTKVDTYSFGMVLFELATALNAIDKRMKFLKDHVLNYPPEKILELKDPKVPGHDFLYGELIRIGKMCVAKRAKDRPNMIQVLLMLEEVAEKNWEQMVG